MNDHYYFNVKRKRPEEIYNKVSDYFRGETLAQYAKSKNIMRIQEKIIIRALEILNLRNFDAVILDAGCGPGFAAIYLNEIGYRTVALDIIKEFLFFYDLNNLNPITADMCFSPFRLHIFDAIISISALQWIYRENNNVSMEKNLIYLAQSFYNILKPNAKAVIQFYPKNTEIMNKIGKIIAKSTKFTGNFIIDNPNKSKKRRIFLILEKV